VAYTAISEGFAILDYVFMVGVTPITESQFDLLMNTETQMENGSELMAMKIGSLMSLAI